MNLEFNQDDSGKKKSFDWRRLVWNFEFSVENSKGMVTKNAKNLNVNLKHYFIILKVPLHMQFSLIFAFLSSLTKSHGQIIVLVNLVIPPVYILF